MFDSTVQLAATFSTQISGTTDMYKYPGIHTHTP